MSTPLDASQQPRSIGATGSENSISMIPEPPAVTAPVEPEAARLECVALEKAFRKGDHVIPVLRGVDIDVAPGEFLSIVGQSGSGKSTLLHVMGLLDVPSVGEVHCDGRRIDNLPESQRDRLRNREFGFIFQSYHLLPELTLLENVVSPLSIRYSTLAWWQHRHQIRDQAAEIVEKVGLGHRLKHRPAELSGGEMQRTAIARALIGQPRVLLADEPTGNLDSNTGQEIMSLLASLNEFEGLTIIMVTHDERIACRAHRTVRLGEGRIEMVGRAA
ncbi:MAG: ABC transporter ATP-binding protein [Planctomycetaceae bacterium]|jgi:lipoprotein-releasing system ATP-binding protein|nr:ABC transporter ATP-binding protein [Planctomycetaceae bacterium]